MGNTTDLAVEIHVEKSCFGKIGYSIEELRINNTKIHLGSTANVSNRSANVFKHQTLSSRNGSSTMDTSTRFGAEQNSSVRNPSAFIHILHKCSPYCLRDRWACCKSTNDHRKKGETNGHQTIGF